MSIQSQQAGVRRVHPPFFSSLPCLYRDGFVVFLCIIVGGSSFFVLSVNHYTRFPRHSCPNMCPNLSAPDVAALQYPCHISIAVPMTSFQHPAWHIHITLITSANKTTKYGNCGYDHCGVLNSSPATHANTAACSTLCAVSMLQVKRSVLSLSCGRTSGPIQGTAGSGPGFWWTISVGHL